MHLQVGKRENGDLYISNDDEETSANNTRRSEKKKRTKNEYLGLADV